METGTIPLKSVFKSRRLCYLKTIPGRDSEEIVKEVYNAQKDNPYPGDFFNLVKKDASDVKTDISDEIRIITMKDDKYKSEIKDKVRQAAFEIYY